MAQVVAARFDMIPRNQRPLTVRMDDDGFDGGISMAGFVIDCSVRRRRSLVAVSSSRSDIVSRTNTVTITVNKVHQ